MLKTQIVKVYPNIHMTKHINDLFNYRRYCWNQALETWNDMYDASVIMDDKTLRPNENAVRDELVADKKDWQYQLSARVLQVAVNHLQKAWQNYFNSNMPNHNKPRFKSKKRYKHTFTTDRARIVNGKLVLDKPRTIAKQVWYGIRMSDKPRFDGTLKTCTITKHGNALYAALAFDTEHVKTTSKTTEIAGVDVNIKHMNYNGGIVETYPKSLEVYYQRITYYQRLLARKREANPFNYQTKRYTKVITKLRRDYRKVNNIQNDIIQKFTTMLVNKYPEIHIEDLDVQHMMMSKKMGKNLHRSMFGQFAVMLDYKCDWNDRKLIKVNRMYPSTQICSECGFRKTKDGYGGKQTLSGDAIHHNHQAYYCYNCGAIIDRDENAVKNIINYNEHSMDAIKE